MLRVFDAVPLQSLGFVVKETICSQGRNKVHDKIAADSLITFHTEKTITDGSSLKKDSIVHWTPTGPVMKDGKPEAAKMDVAVTVDPDTRWKLIGLLFLQLVFVTMVYGPIAAFLVEMFPVRIRYTSMSLPYHIGNGIFGGLLPAVATYLVTNAKDTGHAEWYLQGLWYPIIVAAVSLIIGFFYLNGKDRNVED